MAGKPIIAVFGATGNQGGSVARSLAASKSFFQVRGLTRNPGSVAACTLAELEVSLVKTDGWDQDQMEKSLEGVWGLFMNTNSEDPIFSDGSGRTEFQLGKIVVNAAIKTGVKHIVYSSAGSPEEQTNGKFKMSTMMMKNKIEKYIRHAHHFETATFINAGWYMELFKVKEIAPVFGGFPHYPDEEGVLTFCCPRWGGDRRIPWLSVSHDFGDMVHGIFLDPTRWDGEIIHGASHLATFDVLTDTFQKVTGKKARYREFQPSWETWDTHGVQALQEVKELFGFIAETEGQYMGPEATDITNALALKKQGAAARGKSGEELKLLQIDQFFAKEFAAVV